MIRWRLWQWMLLGLFLGALGGIVRTALGPGFDTTSNITLNPLVFEQYVLNHRSGGKEVVAVRQLTVHPAFDDTGIDWVTGVATLQYNAPEDPKNPKSPMKRWQDQQPFRFSTTVPYAPNRNRRGEEIPLRMGNLSQYPDNRAYLSAMVEKFPEADIHFRYAWWDQGNISLGLWTLSGFVLFGLIIPLIARQLSPRVPEEKGVDLRKVRSSKPQPIIASGPSQADQDQLAALEAQLEQNLQGAFPEDAPALDDSATQSDAPAAAPIRKLESAPVEASKPVEAPEEPREYTGEYYPVAKQTTQHGKEGSNPPPPAQP